MSSSLPHSPLHAYMSPLPLTCALQPPFPSRLTHWGRPTNWNLAGRQIYAFVVAALVEVTVLTKVAPYYYSFLDSFESVSVVAVYQHDLAKVQ